MKRKTRILAKAWPLLPFTVISACIGQEEVTPFGDESVVITGQMPAESRIAAYGEYVSLSDECSRTDWNTARSERALAFVRFDKQRTAEGDYRVEVPLRIRKGECRWLLLKPGVELFAGTADKLFGEEQPAAGVYLTYRSGYQHIDDTLTYSARADGLRATVTCRRQNDAEFSPLACSADSGLRANGSRQWIVIDEKIETGAPFGIGQATIDLHIDTDS